VASNLLTQRDIVERQTHRERNLQSNTSSLEIQSRVKKYIEIFVTARREAKKISTYAVEIAYAAF
jgi:hypothetical protein